MKKLIILIVILIVLAMAIPALAGEKTLNLQEMGSPGAGPTKILTESQVCKNPELFSDWIVSYFGCSAAVAFPDPTYEAAYPKFITTGELKEMENIAFQLDSGDGIVLSFRFKDGKLDAKYDPKKMTETAMAFLEYLLKLNQGCYQPAGEVQP